MIESLLQSPSSWTNFSFFRISGAPIICSPWFRYIRHFGRAKSDGIYAREDWTKPSWGRFGLLQTVADVLKLLLKEDSIPKAQINRYLY